MTNLRSFVAALSMSSIALLLAACGGATEPVGPGGAGGSGSGENNAQGGAGGGGGSGNAGVCTMAPACPNGDKQVASAGSCPDNGAPCYEVTACGTSVWCVGAGIQCAAFPSCKSGFVEVKTCVPDAECVKETLCGATILCMRDAQCDGLPNCDPGHKEIASPSECLQDDAVCYSRTTCGVTIWCTGPS